MLMLKHCCCGCTLKTGVLIISVVFAILAALHVLLFSVAAVEAADYLQYSLLALEMEKEESIDSNFTTTASSVAMSTTEEKLLNATYDDDMSSQDPMPIDLRVKVIVVWMWVSILIAVVEAAVLLISVFLMFAANKDSARFVYVWVLGFTGFSACLLVLQLIIAGLLFYALSTVPAVFFLVKGIVETAGAAYSVLVGYSFYKQLVGTAVARRISCQAD